MALGGGAARDVDLFEDRGRRADRQARAAVLLRDQGGKETAFGQVLHELGRISGARLEIAPVGAGVLLADAPHRLAQFGIILAELERDRSAARDWTFDVHHAALRASA